MAQSLYPLIPTCCSGSCTAFVHATDKNYNRKKVFLFHFIQQEKNAYLNSLWMKENSTTHIWQIQAAWSLINLFLERFCLLLYDELPWSLSKITFFLLRFIVLSALCLFSPQVHGAAHKGNTLWSRGTKWGSIHGRNGMQRYHEPEKTNWRMSIWSLTWIRKEKQSRRKAAVGPFIVYKSKSNKYFLNVHVGKRLLKMHTPFRRYLFLNSRPNSLELPCRLTKLILRPCLFWCITLVFDAKLWCIGWVLG